MKIAIDARPATGRRSGVGNYLHVLLHELAELDQRNEYLLFVEQGATIEPGLPKNFRTVAVAGRLLRWHLAVARACRRAAVDVYHSPESPIVPFILRRRSILTIHDLSALRFPGVATWRTRLYQWSLFVAARRVGRIAADSGNTRTDVISLLKGRPGHVRVVYPAVSRRFRPLHDAAALSAVRRKLALPERFILFVGTLEPRKNLQRLVRAFHAVKTDRPCKLVVVGARGWKFAPIFETVKTLGMQARVVFADYVADEDLVGLYSLAEGFVYPSLYEGFGLPLLEAMTCGCPALAGSASSLPEIAADAALLVEPTDEEALADGITRLLGNEALRADLAARGLERSALFSGSRFAQALLDLYRETAQESGS